MSTLGEDYLAGNGGPAHVCKYHDGLTQGQRIGQAFFNALTPKDMEILTGSEFDPFYFDNNECVESAVGYLLDCLTEFGPHDDHERCAEMLWGMQHDADVAYEAWRSSYESR